MSRWALALAVGLVPAKLLADVGTDSGSLSAVSMRDSHEVIAGSARRAVCCDRGGDGRGFARFGLPSAELGVAWRAELGSNPAALGYQGPLVTEEGDLVVVSPNGAVVTVTPAGEVRSRVETGTATGGPPSVLLNGTVVFLGARGELVGVRGPRVVFRTATAIAPARSKEGSIVPLRDGGFVVSLPSSREWIAVSSEGRLGARRVTSEPTAVPLIQHDHNVVAIGASGGVFAWDGAGALRTLGRLSGAPSSAAMVVEHRVLAIVHGSIESIDLVSGAFALAVADGSAPWVGQLSANDSGDLLAFSKTQFVAHLRAVAGESSAAVSAYELVTETPIPSRRASGTDSPASGYVGPLVSATGVAVFATGDGTLVRVAPGAVESVGPFCNSGGTATAGIAATADKQVALLCGNGVLTLVRGEFRLAIQKNPG